MLIWVAEGISAFTFALVYSSTARGCLNKIRVRSYLFSDFDLFNLLLSTKLCLCDIYSIFVRFSPSTVAQQLLGSSCTESFVCLTSGAVCSGAPAVCACPGGLLYDAGKEACGKGAWSGIEWKWLDSMEWFDTFLSDGNHNGMIWSNGI